MGGREPHSKRGIVRHLPMEVSDEYRQIILWRVEELANALGYELQPKTLEVTREIEAPIQPVRYTEKVAKKPFEHEFHGTRETEIAS